MLKLFRGIQTSPNHTPVSMVGARPGDKVLFCGASRPDLAGEVGAITGLNGQTAVAGQAADADRIAGAAAAAGALVDFVDAPLTALPFEDDVWDAAVLVDGVATGSGQPDPVLGEAVRVLRPGGRVIVIDGIARAGFFPKRRRPDANVPADAFLTALGAAGLRAARLLADVDDVRYFEAVKPQRPSA